MSANREREERLVPPGYKLVAARTRLLATRLLEEIPPVPEHVLAERLAALDDAVATRYPRRVVPVPLPEPHEGDDMTRERLRRLMPGRTPKPSKEPRQ